MRRVTWSERALADLDAARIYLDTERPEMTQVVLDRIVLSTDRLLEMPGIGTPMRYRRWRKWRVRRTGFFVFYQSDFSGLIVVRILHGRSEWRSVAG